MGLCVITGAAGGMGAPTAQLFAKHGHALLLCDLSADHLERVAQLLRMTGAAVETLVGDIADPAFPKRLIDAIGGRAMDAVVHTAGISPSMADGLRILEVNYFATERLLGAIGATMAEGGCIVLISSSSAYMVRSAEADEAIGALVSGDDPAPALAMANSPQMAYPLSKRALIALVAREAVTLGPRHIRIVSISPGFIDTGMGRAELEASSRKAAMVAKVPLGRMGAGTEIASVAHFLCSPAASYINGCDIKVDGGALAALGFV